MVGERAADRAEADHVPPDRQHEEGRTGLAVPLTTGTVSVARDRALAADARPVAEERATTGKWQIASVQAPVTASS